MTKNKGYSQILHLCFTPQVSDVLSLPHPESRLKTTLSRFQSMKMDFTSIECHVERRDREAKHLIAIRNW
ncbi:hypothetical protein [Pleurocapsa sp. PCC 7327]|uniref:hypothetical protein n=1 Tax=Pleurocapsa sp. PCC 7327 TaxID=118163 RepID=UPI001185D361|nr:hypothetical protein [Pleurocapsa sp. PCC 7327]